MNKRLYEFHELLAPGVLEVGKIVETVNLGESNFKMWIDPKTNVLEYVDYPEQVLTLIHSTHDDFPETTDGNEVLYRIIN